MSEVNYIRPVPEQVYEDEKILKVETSRLQVLGFYAIRIMLPPGAADHAIESASTILAAERIAEDTWHVDFTMFEINNSGSIIDAVGQFSDDGNMFVENSDTLNMPQFGPKILMGYFMDVPGDNSHMLEDSVQIPEVLTVPEFEQSRPIPV